MKSLKKILTLIFLISSAGFLALSSQENEGKVGEREALFYKYLEFSRFIKGGKVEPHWMADGSSFWYAEGDPAETVIYKVDPQKKSKIPLFDNKRLREALRCSLGYEPPYQGIPFKDFSFLDGEKAVKFFLEEREFICYLESYKISEVPPLAAKEKERSTARLVRKGFYAGEPDEWEILSPDEKWYLGVSKNNLYLRSTYDGRIEPLTEDGVKDSEWSISGAKWSPQSLKVAAMKVDTRKVLRLPIIHWLKTTEEVEWAPYSKAGGPIPQFELFVVDILSKKKTKLETGEESDHYYTFINWSNSGSEIFFGRTDRTHHRVDLMLADSETGKSRIIFTEMQKTFVFGIDKPPFEKIKFLKDKQKFLWISEKDGWAHIYLYDIEGNLIKRLTNGSFPVLEIIAVDEKENKVFFTAHAESRIYDTHLYCVDFEGKGLRRLTEGRGQHQTQFSPSNEFFIDTHSDMAREPVVELKKAEGSLVQILSKANIDSVIKDLKWVPPEEFIVKADDGITDLYGVLFKPHDFDPQKKYPVIDYIYNGPQTTWVPRTFADPRSILPQALAQLGFITFVVDGRGTPERGKAFQDVVYKNFGRHEIPDHVTALKQLSAARPYLDLKRVGIFGGSWGGYMTMRAMLLAPEVYHVGVAINPVYDHFDHPAAAIEPYMGLPQKNRAAYEYSSNLNLVERLKGKLFIIHSTCDVNAPFSASIKMAEALIRANKPFDFLVLPDEDHHPEGASQRYWIEALKRYFTEHLLCKKRFTDKEENLGEKKIY